MYIYIYIKREEYLHIHVCACVYTYMYTYDITAFDSSVYVRTIGKVRFSGVDTHIYIYIYKRDMQGAHDCVFNNRAVCFDTILHGTIRPLRRRAPRFQTCVSWPG